ncbi:acyl-CoA desaturase [Croceicoccus estronivorus]|uniref:acyl-CoA desaturase n=1 Tax=Croceicoccus estronivorus TaxID=1172626 RepID=UPI000A572BFD|nr:acyl-CoA desaturase [Croceicoccus estronivorus]
METKLIDDPVQDAVGRADVPLVPGRDADVVARPARGKTYEDLIIERWRSAVRFGGPEAAERRREHLVYAAIKQGGALAALAYIVLQPTSWVEWSGFAFFYVLNILGMSIGYHRYFTHKAFETSKPMRYAFGALAQMGVYGSLKRWCMDHRRHHTLSDQPGDIHSPYVDDYGRPLAGRKGLKHAHLGWAYGEATTNPDMYGKGIVGDPVIEWAHKTRYFWFAVSAVIAPGLWGLAFGGPGAVLGTIMVAGFLRLALALHMIAAVNSFGHRYGYQNFKDLDQARNNLFLGYLTLGEGWHNNHHAHPRGVSTSVRWYEIDASAWVIYALEKLGLVWNVQRPDMHARPHHR